METVEFRTSPDGHVYYSINGDKEQRLTKFSTDIIGPLITIVRNRFPECYARLAILYKENASQMCGRFIRCNFGEHDLLTQDIEHDLLNFEEVHCPLRGICPDERVICKPKSLIRLSEGQKDIVRLYINGYKIDSIAAELGKNRSTVKTQLLRIRDKLNVKSCRDIIKVFRLGKFML